MNVMFKINGEPVGKGRPRFARRGVYVCTYTPKKTSDYEIKVKQAYLEQCGIRYDDISIEMHIIAYFGIPKNTNKVDRERMIRDEIRPAKKPDCDNIIKIIADGLNGVAYKDDKQIVKVECEKFYSLAPCVQVFLSGID